jgi:hypothetical protein
MKINAENIIATMLLFYFVKVAFFFFLIGIDHPEIYYPLPGKAALPMTIYLARFALPYMVGILINRSKETYSNLDIPIRIVLLLHLCWTFLFFLIYRYFYKLLVPYKPCVLDEIDFYNAGEVKLLLFADDFILPFVLTGLLLLLVRDRKQENSCLV